MPDSTDKGIVFPIADDFIKHNGQSTPPLVDQLRTMAQTTDNAINAEIGTLRNSAFQWKSQSLLPDSVLSWTGVGMLGYYAIPTGSMVERFSGVPQGARRGFVHLMPLGSTHTAVRWVEEGVPAPQTFERTVSTVDGDTTPWRQVPRTKMTGLALTRTGGVTPKVITDGAQRNLFSYGFGFNRFRLHLRNYNLRDSVGYPGRIEIVGISIGEADTDSNGYFNGAWVPGTEEFLIGSTVHDHPNASEWISPWVDYEIEKNKTYLLSLGWKTNAGQNIVQAQGGGFILSGGSTQTHTVAPTAVQSSTTSFDLWLEAEIDESVEIHAISGDSLTVGTSSTYPIHDSWFARWCKVNGHAPRFYAASGDTLANFRGGTSWKHYVWDGMAPADSHRIALGANDIFGASLPLSEMKTLLAEHWEAIKPSTSDNLILCTIWPRLAPDSAQETIRQQYNDWLSTLPHNATLCLDTAWSISNPEGNALNPKYQATPTDIHLSSAGYGRVASALQGGVSPVST